MNGARTSMSARMNFTAGEARRISEQTGIDWSSSPFHVEQFRAGFDVELEHAPMTLRPTSPAMIPW